MIYEGITMSNESNEKLKNKDNSLSIKLMYNIGTLIFSVFLVHSIYLFSIRPNAQSILALAEQNNISAPRSLSIILMNYEQEFCIILMLWAIFMLAEKINNVVKQNYMMDMDFLEFKEGEDPSKGDLLSAIDKLKKIKIGFGDNVLIQTLSSSLKRYSTTRNLQNASETAISTADNIGMRLEAELSMIRYIIWAIPSIGFIGTVRGIGDALSQADVALEGDISGMTASLGVAFNSTFVALLISILLMFLLHQIQQMYDQLILDAQGYCDEYFINKIY